MSDYLDGARMGKNEWWRYLLSLPAILVTWIVLGLIPVLMLMVYLSLDGDPATGVSETGFAGVPILTEFTALMLSFVPFFVATPLAVRFIHARPVKTLITSADRIRWGRVFTGAGVWMILAALISIIESLLHPGRYVLTFQPSALLLFTLLALLMIPIQTSAEELFFRGYLLQWMGLRWKNKWFLAAINGVLFFLPHTANPEMEVDSILIGLGYFVMGFFLAVMTMRDHGMELALGMHAGNNLFAALFANYTVTSLPSPSLFTIQVLDPVFGLISLAAGLILYLFIFFPPTRIGTARLPQ